MKEYLTEELSKLIGKDVKKITPGIKYAIKKNIVTDLLVATSDTFNSVTLDINNNLTYSPVDANSIVVYKESTSTFYQRYSDWTCDPQAGTIKFLSTGDIVGGTNIVVEYKYYKAAGELIAHDLGGVKHSADTLAHLNDKISDAELDDKNDPRTDLNAIHDDEAGEISALGEKGSPVAADLVIIEDSEDSNNKKKVQLSNISVGGGNDISPEPDSDNGYKGFYATMTAGENLSAADLCYLKNDGKFYKTDADSAATIGGRLAIATETINADSTGIFLLYGVFRHDAWSWNTGATLYVSSNTGEMTETAPGTERIIGEAYNDDCIFFDPEPYVYIAPSGLETFDSDDTLDDGEAYGIFTNREGNSGDGYVSGGVYTSEYADVTNNYAYLVTTDSIGSTFNYQVEFITAITGWIVLDCGIYLGASAPTTNFDADSTTTSLVNIWLRRSTSTFRVEVTRTTNGASKQFWNFSTHAWQAGESAWDGFIPSNAYRFTITRDGTNTVIEIYDITGDTLIEEITSANADMISIGSNAYFYFGSVESYGGDPSDGDWDNAGPVS